MFIKYKNRFEYHIWGVRLFFSFGVCVWFKESKLCQYAIFRLILMHRIIKKNVFFSAPDKDKNISKISVWTHVNTLNIMVAFFFSNTVSSVLFQESISIFCVLFLAGVFPHHFCLLFHSPHRRIGNFVILSANHLHNESIHMICSGELVLWIPYSLRIHFNVFMFSFILCTIWILIQNNQIANHIDICRIYENDVGKSHLNAHKKKLYH